jgi:2-(1,2-epoxy-1,2-dihydrophenyl)acetyl-CoA isomerase
LAEFPARHCSGNFAQKINQSHISVSNEQPVKYKDKLMPYETILYDLNGPVLTITLNRPDKLNALTAELLHELRAAFEQAGNDQQVRVIVLTGAGRGFCAGADLAAASALRASEVDFSYSKMLSSTYHPLILTMTVLPKPIIAAVNGVAAGAGMSLALACDLRIAAESASFVQAFIKIGLVPDSGSTWLLPRLIGTARALELMMSGRKVSAWESRALGIANQVVSDAELSSVVDAIANQYAVAPTKTIGYLKQAVNFALSSTLADALAKEADMQDMAGNTSDHFEGVAAFLQKRPPLFTGE